ncbi:TetR/AcrR family transcriptional regulator [Microlunatus sp. Y2014]|uniref:TetR/AcrR family transcriptional regulator n=1 Tax=Microlunatus sp. Y2014 TaxID=3418488 RepID=UPI003DA76174
MPRGAGSQHETQLRRLGDAAMRVLARDGLPALTFRSVAVEAGVSPGRVQHYARTGKGLITLTFRRFRELTQERVRESVGSVPSPTPIDVVEATLQALIPHGDQDRTLLHVAAAVELHALTDPGLAEELRGGRAELIRFLAEQVGREWSGKRSVDPLALSRAATTLLATAEGLSTLALTGTIDGAEAQLNLHTCIRTTLTDFPATSHTEPGSGLR